MIVKEQDGMRWHEFELFQGLPMRHATFTRHGGFSQGEFASLNVGKSGGDKLEHVLANQQKILHALKLPHLVSGRLTHGKQVCCVDIKADEQPLCDALATDKSNFGVMITHADCQAAIFYDPVQHVMANVHCGWRGNAQNIYAEVVQHLHKRYGCHAADLLVGISPSLGPESAEFSNYRMELPKSFWGFQTKPHYFDLWQISCAQLQAAGVLGHHIQCAEIDTFASSDYFSYRRSKDRGRMATLCALI